VLSRLRALVNEVVAPVVEPSARRSKRDRGTELFDDKPDLSPTHRRARR
jgi:hypothetical protein